MDEGLQNQGIRGASDGPGSRASTEPQSTQRLGPSGFDPSRDFVNGFFRAHYPPDADTAWVTEYCAGGCERRYDGAYRETHSTIFPLMRLADGLELSVQGHFGAYSTPRGDFEDYYSRVEIMGPAGLVGLGERSETCGDQAVYPYVPVGDVNAFIAAHGGFARDSDGSAPAARPGTGLDPKDDSAGHKASPGTHASPGGYNDKS